MAKGKQQEEEEIFYSPFTFFCAWMLLLHGIQPCNPAVTDPAPNTNPCFYFAVKNPHKIMK